MSETPLEFSPTRPTVRLHLAPSAARRDTTIQKKKEVFHYRDDSNLMAGPFELSTLQLWAVNGLIPKNLLIYDGASPNPTPLCDLLASKGVPDLNPSEQNEWFLWTDSKTPFHSLNTRLNKYFTSRHQITDFKLLSIVSQTHQITLNSIQEFEDFLEQMNEISPDIKDLNLNSFAEPFAMWTYKTLADLDCKVPAGDVKQLLLESDPDRVKEFFMKNIPQEKDALKLFNAYNQWRMFIPVFEVPK
ncbi:hypothetical protein TRFO_05024 [Tritrichomonas foetus]|uniref:GYF domain-containing protein n=1 Tax=Tritrichomonas foetus TaxID=1144522 RepID=A0A1J4KAC4_9EUKA|nr:hypothetical protein TRFO_05024 [Tritrichomonas foetus]|eukprot:OHT07914.1 hypothetical protein TRFO_05024 [Tritrichomonas foetus]